MLNFGMKAGLLFLFHKNSQISNGDMLVNKVHSV